MKKAMPAGRQGFVLVELIIVVGIIATLFTIGYVRVIDIQRRVPLNATVDTLVADLRGQQTKAMTGETEGVGGPDSYGIAFQATSYTLIPTNAVVTLPTNITFSAVTFPDASVVFTNGSGDVGAYTDGANTVTITQTLTGEHKTITVNRYGSVTSVQ